MDIDRLERLGMPCVPYQEALRRAEGGATDRAEGGAEVAEGVQPGTIYLIDDDAGFRHSFQWLLSSEGFRVLTFPDSASFILGYCDSGPAVLLVDLCLGDENGNDVVRAFRRQQIKIPMVMISAAATVSDTVRSFREGVFDFLEKPHTKDAVLNAVKRCLAIDGERRSECDYADRRAQLFARLSQREWDVLKLLLSGLRNKEVADQLGLSPKTVECHRANLMAKTGVHSIAELAAWYWQSPESAGKQRKMNNEQ